MWCPGKSSSALGGCDVDLGDVLGADLGADLGAEGLPVGTGAVRAGAREGSRLPLAMRVTLSLY